MIDNAKRNPKYDSGSHQDVLMKALGFTYDDLDANRGGYMSKKQRSALSQERHFLRNYGAIIIGGTALLCAVIILGSVIEAGEISYGLLSIVLIFLIPVFMSLLIWFQRNRIKTDLHKGTVYVVEGFIRLFKTSYNQGAISYYLQVQDQKFQLKKPVFLTFKNGEPYAIYYAPHSKTILSAEWLRDTEVNDFAGDNDG